MSDTALRDQLAQIVYDTLNGQYGDFNMPDDATERGDGGFGSTGRA